MPAPEQKLFRVEPSDPRRCKSVGSGTGQCPFQAEEGLDYCPRHKGFSAASQRNQSLRNYRLGKWEQRIAEFADSDGVKSLRDEIGITRMMLEQILSKCQDDTDILMALPRLNDLVSRVERLVVSCHKLETSTGLLLDKAAALALAGKMVEIIGKYVTHAESVDNIANEIGIAILGIGGTAQEDMT